MSYINTQTNLFPAAPHEFTMLFDRMPGLTFFCQEPQIPGISASAVNQPAPYQAKRIPTKLTYDPLVVSFLIDDQYTAYREMYSWLRGMTGGPDKPFYTAQFAAEKWTLTERPSEHLVRAATTTAGLTLVDAHKQPTHRIVFFDLFPTALSGVSLTTKVADPLNMIMTATVTFEYDYWAFVELSE